MLIVNYISLSYSLTGAQVFPSKDSYPSTAFNRRLSTQLLNVFNDMMILIGRHTGRTLGYLAQSFTGTGTETGFRTGVLLCRGL